MLGIFIFFNPFPRTTAIEEASFYLALAISVFLIARRRIDFSLDSPFKYPFLIYVLWSMFGLVFAENVHASFHDILFHLVKYVILYFLLINFFRTRRQFENLVWLAFISAAVFSIGGMLYFYGYAGNPLTERIDFKQLPLNIMGHVPIFAIIIGIKLFASRNERHARILIFFCISVMTLLILLTNSRGSLLGLAFGIILLAKENKKLIISLVLIFIVVSFALPNRFIQQKFYTSGRAEIWETYVQAIEKRPVTGLGFDLSFWQDPQIAEKYSLTVKMFNAPMDPHNIFISNAIRLGLVGLALYLFILFTFLRVSWKLAASGKDDYVRSWALFMAAAFCAYVVKGQFDESLSHVPAIIFYTTLALQTVLWTLNKESDQGHAISCPCSDERISHSDTVSRPGPAS